MELELAPYQQRVRASEIQAGDFVDLIEPTKLRGPRGGKYRYDGVRVESRVERVVWLVGSVAGGLPEEMEIKDDWRPGRPVGFRLYTRVGRVTLPGNLADLTTAVVRRAS